MKARWFKTDLMMVVTILGMRGECKRVKRVERGEREWERGERVQEGGKVGEGDRDIKGDAGLRPSCRNQFLDLQTLITCLNPL